MLMIQLNGAEEISRQLNQLDEAMQQKILPIIADYIVTASQVRIDSQTDVSGAAFAVRSKSMDEKIAQKKMLLGLRDKLRVLSINENTAVVGFDSDTTEKIAADQQFGTVSKGSLAQEYSESMSQPATRKQAVQLIQLGFKIDKHKPTIEQITSQYTIAQAGFALRKLKGWSGIAVKSEWDIVIPARAFLGITDTDQQAILLLIKNTMNQELSND